VAKALLSMTRSRLRHPFSRIVEQQQRAALLFDATSLPSSSARERLFGTHKINGRPRSTPLFARPGEAEIGVQQEVGPYRGMVRIQQPEQLLSRVCRQPPLRQDHARHEKAGDRAQSEMNIAGTEHSNDRRSARFPPLPFAPGKAQLPAQPSGGHIEMNFNPGRKRVRRDRDAPFPLHLYLKKTSSG